MVGSKKHKGDNDEDDLTKEMDDPPAEPNVSEVNVSKPGKNWTHTIFGSLNMVQSASDDCH